MDREMGAKGQRGDARTFIPISPVPDPSIDRSRQRNGTRKENGAGKNRTNIWSWLFGQGSRRTAQRTKRLQNGEVAKQWEGTPTISNGLRQSGPSLPVVRNGSNLLKSVGKPGLDNGNGLSPSRSVHSRDSGSRSQTALQPNVQSGIRDRYNQLLPVRGNSNRSSIPSGESRLLTRPDATLLNGNGSRPAVRSRRQPLPSKPQSPGVSAALYAVRMVILSVGVGVLAGTALSMWDPASRSPVGGQQAKQASAATSGSNQSGEPCRLVKCQDWGRKCHP